MNQSNLEADMCDGNQARSESANDLIHSLIGLEISSFFLSVMERLWNQTQGIYWRRSLFLIFIA